MNNTVFSAFLDSSNAVLTPLTTETQAATSVQKLNIKLKLQQQFKKIDVTIKLNNQIYFTETLNSKFLQPGEHSWEWNGFDKNGNFQSKDFINSTFEFLFTASDNNSTSNSTIKLKSSLAGKKWLDTKISNTNNSIDVNLRLNLQDGGAKGVGEFPPKEVQRLKGYKSLKSGDPRTLKHTRYKNLNDLRSLVISGMKKYWSRQITTPDGKKYSVNVNAQHSVTDAMDDIKLVYNTNGKWLRSSNPGTVKSPLSLFGNFIGEKIAYNIGWVKYSNGWGYEWPIDADNAFSETAAHEIGHEILGAFKGDKYSYGHKGSSTVITQKRKSPHKGGFTYPPKGEIDLMKYYNGARPNNFYSRVKASEEDVESLLWLSRVKFKNA